MTNTGEYMRMIAHRVVQGELSHETALESLRAMVCTETDVISVAEEARSLTHSEPELAFVLLRLGYEAATQINSAPGRALCAFRMGTLHKARGQYREAIERYLESLALFQDLGYQMNISAALTQLGALHFHLSQYPQARDYLERGLAMSRQHGYLKHEGVQLGNLGLICLVQGDYPRAEEYLGAALKIARDLKDMYNEATWVSNLGIACRYQGDYSGALRHFEDALAVRRQIGNRFGESSALANSRHGQVVNPQRSSPGFLRRIFLLLNDSGDPFIIQSQSFGGSNRSVLGMILS